MTLNEAFTRALKVIRIVLVIILIAVCIAFVCYLKQIFFVDNQTSSQGQENAVGEAETSLVSQDGLTVNKKYIGDIPVIEYYNESTGISDKPIVIIEYGVTGKKEEMQAVAAVYANIGCLVVTPDLYLHGERVEESDCCLLEIAVRSSGEIEEILNYYSTSSMVDMDRIGMIGFSLGGMTIYYYLANGTYPVKTAGIICSTPDWEELQNYPVIYQCYSNGKLVKLPEERHEEVAHYVTENSPYDELILKTDISYGLISGGKDEVLSYVGAEKFYSEYVANGGTAVYQKDDELGHELRVDDLWSIYYYFTENL